MHYLMTREVCTPRAGQHLVIAGESYVLGGKEGDGAVGVVSKVTREKDGDVQAIKFLAPDPHFIDPVAFADVAVRFRREGDRGAQLKHAHLVRIYSYNENEDGICFADKSPATPFLLMEYIRGRTLENYIKKYSGQEYEFDITRERLHIAIQIARALEDLHHLKIIHRDVKPANIFVKQARSGGLPLVKLGDLGVVKWGDFNPALSTGVVTSASQRGLGTMKYMSPEQAMLPKEVKVSSDMFSFGITLIELFTGAILASPHHVLQFMTARMARGSTYSKFNTVGYQISSSDEDVATAILDMFLRGVDGRPKIREVRGRLEFTYEQKFGSDWKDDLDEKIYQLTRPWHSTR